MIDVKQFSSDKILAHIDRVNDWMSKGVSRPITYELDMTNICNNNCPFCFGFYKREESQSSLIAQDAKHIVDQIVEYGGKGLTFTGGGEPLCNPQTLNVLQYARKKGLDIGFISNGLLLSEEKADIIVNNCVWVRISLDAGTSKIYEKTHGLDGDIFEKILKKIEILVGMRKTLGKKITIGLGYLTPAANNEDMRDFVLLGMKLGVDYAQFRPILRRFGEKRIDFDTKETIDYIKKLCDEYSNKKYSVLYSRHKYEALSSGRIVRPYKTCYGHNFATVIGADSKMYLCCHTRGLKKYCIGDLKKNTLKEIWESKRRKNVFKNIDFNDCPYLCRCDSFNTILWHIKREKVHKNFL